MAIREVRFRFNFSLFFFFINLAFLTGGFTIFWCDDGLDTGPILLQKGVDLDPNETIDSLYTRFLYPVGVESMAEAVNLIQDGLAPKIVQKLEGASYEAMLNKPELTRLNYGHLKGEELHNFIRGCDKVPGAWISIDGSPVKLFGSRLWTSALPSNGRSVKVEVLNGESATWTEKISAALNLGSSSDSNALIGDEGLFLTGTDGLSVVISKLGLESGKMISANKFGVEEANAFDLSQLSSEEKQLMEAIREAWASILNLPVENSTDFFRSGAGSMDVTRLVETVLDIGDNQFALANDDVYMASEFEEFVKLVMTRLRGGDGDSGDSVKFEGVTLNANKRTINCPTQLFINNQFVNSSTGQVLPSINPADESVIAQVQAASAEDVDRAVEAAEKAFYDGEWSAMNARDRGEMILRLADLMEKHKEELATLESLDSGAVYTLAVKTHIGMSIQTWRYFAGWCDKIEGTTIPINHARPKRNLTITKREPIGVCGIITPWNYPLMMVSWKMAACLAAGNTVVLKPAQVSPLTALKLAELSVRAGFPPGVINIVPGSGRVVGEAIANHPKIRKLGFTGSTPVGKQIMKSCAVSNLKKVSLELGGKSPLIIFADSDLDLAVRGAMGGVFFNKGENCIAAGRIFVERSIHDRFISRILREVKKIKIGDPLDRSTDHGPQNHRAHMEKLIEYVELGVKEGAKLLYGGKQVPRPGLYFEPTVFSGVTDEMYIAQEESFGPIMIISVFENIQGKEDVERLIKRANATEFGLASGVFTRDLSKAMQVAEKIEAGTCFVNCYNKTDVAAPFGGKKTSGFGKDLGADALKEYLHTKTITIEY